MKICLCLFALVNSFAFGIEAVALPDLEMVVQETSKGFIVDVFSATPLKEPKLEYGLGTWLDFYPNQGESKNGFQYRLKSYQKLQPKTLVTVKSDDSENTVRLVSFSVPEIGKDCAEVSLDQAATKTKTKAEWKKEILPPGQAGILMQLINAHRIRHGRQPLYYDERLNFSDSASHANFYRSGLAGVGAAAWSSTSNAHASFGMWLRSGDHNAQMLHPNIRRCGFGYGNGTNFVGAP